MRTDAGLRVTPEVLIPPGELSWRFSRASGPGGQGVNTTDSRVELTFDVANSGALSVDQRTRALQRLGSRLVDGQVTVVAAEHRSQLRNRDAAADRLARLLRQALAAPARPRRPTTPTAGSRQRRLEAKTRRAHVKAMRRSPTD